jgi:hypothetical protein
MVLLRDVRQLFGKLGNRAVSSDSCPAGGRVASFGGLQGSSAAGVRVRSTLTVLATVARYGPRLLLTRAAAVQS